MFEGRCKFRILLKNMLLLVLGIFLYVNLSLLFSMFFTKIPFTDIKDYRIIVDDMRRSGKSASEINLFLESKTGRDMLSKKALFDVFILHSIISFLVGIIVGVLNKKEGYLLAPLSIAIYYLYFYYHAFINKGESFPLLKNISSLLLYLLLAFIGGYLILKKSGITRQGCSRD